MSNTPERADWVEVFRAFGDALVAVVRAEVAVLGEQLKRSGKTVGIALGAFIFSLLSFALMFTLMVYAAVHFIADFWELPIWGGALIVVALIAVAVSIVGAIVAWLWKRDFENPMESAKGRWQAHLSWWHEDLLLSEGDES